MYHAASSIYKENEVRLRFPCDRAVLAALSEPVLLWAIIVRRICIRYHRDQVGDDRCFLTDWLVWQFLSDTLPRPYFSGEEGMVQCRLYWQYRRDDGVDTLPPGAILDPERWDDDLWTMSTQQLRNKLYELQKAIWVHRDIDGRLRTTDDDRALYAVLPEKLTADFTLPSEAKFLGEQGAPEAGCPVFWRSHGTCASAHCNLYRLGPCG